MDFIPQPEDTKKLGVRWLKWHIYKYPNIFLMAYVSVFAVAKLIEGVVKTNRELRSGKYVPNVVMNRYAICRSDDFSAVSTPSRYRN